MDIKVTCTIAFLTGAAVGIAATWKFAKKKYEQIAQEEIDSVKEVFSRRYSEKKEADKPEEKPDLADYTKKLNNEGYIDKKGEPDEMVGPYVIPPDEFGEKLGHETVSLTYYADGVLADEIDEPMDDDNINKTVGREWVTHFGEYEDDSVFVRNDDLELDFEILMDCRKYSDVKSHSPHTASE